MRFSRIISLLLTTAMLFCFLPTAVNARYVGVEESQAQALKTLGLFKGVSDDNFDLERPATRVEAIVMLIRLIGYEEEALAEHRWHPFTDVPDWANDYIGFAYYNGLANGISDTEFGTGTVSSAMYLTFALRALGYDDSRGDFTWSNPYDLARQLNLIRWNVDLENFLRADIVTVSLATIQAPQKEFPLAQLADWLIFKNVFTYDDYYYAMESIGESVGNMSDYRSLSTEQDDPIIYTLEEEPEYDDIVYITPKGECWHLDPDCGGVNSFAVSASDRRALSRRPCSKCVH